MRILTNFSKKVSTGDYENETFTVTMECDTEFNDAAQVADYLFQEAESAVTRQLKTRNNGNNRPIAKLPESAAKSSRNNSRQRNNVPKQLTSKSSGKQNQNGSNMTDSQRRYLFRLLAERGVEGDDANSTLIQILNVNDLNDVTKSQASKLIDEMVNQPA
ncbi:DUF3072 domain-containing protein [bacterium]|nr:DUF3072 domain-containing protein [bacterium]